MKTVITTPSKSKQNQGFTLIELLIVVAIIAILAAIAVPNLLEAQVRAKVSRSKTDIRTLATALEAYRIDQNNYPAENIPGSPELVPAEDGVPALVNSAKLRPLTTPVTYITSLAIDPFSSEEDNLNVVPPVTYHYASVNDPLYPASIGFFQGNNAESRYAFWILQGNGPDTSPVSYQFPRYDPTNGTTSAGNILRFGP
jgi:type II secretion system protein G